MELIHKYDTGDFTTSLFLKKDGSFFDITLEENGYPISSRTIKMRLVDDAAEALALAILSQIKNKEACNANN